MPITPSPRPPTAKTKRPTPGPAPAVTQTAALIPRTADTGTFYFGPSSGIFLIYVHLQITGVTSLLRLPANDSPRPPSSPCPASSPDVNLHFHVTRVSRSPPAALCLLGLRVTMTRRRGGAAPGLPIQGNDARRSPRMNAGRSRRYPECAAKARLAEERACELKVVREAAQAGRWLWR